MRRGSKSQILGGQSQDWFVIVPYTVLFQRGLNERQARTVSGLGLGFDLVVRSRNVFPAIRRELRTMMLIKGSPSEEADKVIMGPSTPNFYNYVASPSAEKLTIEFFRSGSAEPMIKQELPEIRLPGRHHTVHSRRIQRNGQGLHRGAV
jgi:hypothetical protein